MDESRPETHVPEHHSCWAKPAIMILIGLIGGGSLYFAVMSWYFTGVDPGGGPSGFESEATRSSSAVMGKEDLALEKDVFEIVPLAELHVKIVSGIAESVETPKDSGLMATLEHSSVKISAAQDATAGSHQVVVRDAKGKRVALNVNVKR